VARLRISVWFVGKQVSIAEQQSSHLKSIGAAKQFTPACRVLNFVPNRVRIPPRRNCDRGGSKCNREHNQEWSEARSRCLAISMGGKRALWETHLPQEGHRHGLPIHGCGFRPQSRHGITARNQFESSAPKFSPMTVADVCDHFIQHELTQDNTWRSYSTKKAYKAYLKSDRWLQQAYGHHQATEGSLYSRSKCRRRQRLAWNVRALTAGTLRPSRRAVSALVSPCNSRRRTTVRKFSRRCEIA
jgi:hypothetical protein